MSALQQKFLLIYALIVVFGDALIALFSGSATNVILVWLFWMPFTILFFAASIMSTLALIGVILHW